MILRKLSFAVHPGCFCALLVLVSQQAPAAPFQYTTI